MAARSAKAPHQHRAEASIPATSAAVAAARAIDGPRARIREPATLQHQQLRRSAAFPPRRQARPPRRCGSERNLRHQHPGCGEVAGGTAAGCTAVCCCLPCVVVEVVVLATVRAPAALCRKAARARRGVAGRRRSASAGQAAEMYDLLVDDGGVAEAAAFAEDIMPLPAGEDSVELEKENEMWAKFYGAGFWRSPSQVRDENR
jgi:hypothetical protein